MRLRPEARFAGWLAAGVGLSALTAPRLPQLLGSALGDAFGSVFPAIPFAALLTLIFALRWPELKELLAQEEGLQSLVRTRAFGGGMVAVLLAVEPWTGLSVESSGIAAVATFYAASLMINPLTNRFVLPYAAIYSAGVGAPYALQWAVGQPLAVLSAGISSALSGIAGIPVAWQGTQFQLFSSTGEVVSGVVTPGCSSLVSVTTFLGLLALMHLDLKKDVRSTTMLAALGVVVLVALNSVRILVLLWVGYQDGAETFWGVHNWIGYALFLGFYLAVLPVYSKMGGAGAGFSVGS